MQSVAKIYANNSDKLFLIGMPNADLDLDGEL